MRLGAATPSPGSVTEMLTAGSMALTKVQKSVVSDWIFLKALDISIHCIVSIDQQFHQFSFYSSSTFVHVFCFIRQEM